MKYSIVYSLIQGITEALPVSSSAHIYLLSSYLNAQTGLTLESVLHLGTGLAFIMAFPRSAWMLITGFFDVLRGRWTTLQARWWFFITLGTIPVIIAGAMIHGLGLRFHNPYFMAILCVLFGVILWWVDRKACTRPNISEENLSGAWQRRALVLGMVQMLALLPGVSRLGACLIAARYLGYSRKESLRLSISLGMVSVAACVVLEAPTWATLAIPIRTFVNVIVLSGVSCFGVLTLFRLTMTRFSFFWIMLYRCLLGILLLASIH